MQVSDIHVIVLAAGLSRRMGPENKLLLPYKAHTVVEETISRVISAGFKYITIVIGHDEQSLSQVLSNNTAIAGSVDVVVNSDYVLGQVSSLKCGLEKLSSDCGAFMVALGDMPLIKSEDYEALAENYIVNVDEGKSISRPKNQKDNIGNPVIFSRHFRHELLQNENKESSKSIIKKNKEYLSFYSSEKTCFYYDVDTIADYEKLISLGS